MGQETRHQREYEKKYGQIVAKAWTDEAFKQRLLANPGAVLKEQGIQVPAEVEVKVIELQSVELQQPGQFLFVLPPKPEEVSDEELARVAGTGLLTGLLPKCWCHGPRCVLA